MANYDYEADRSKSIAECKTEFVNALEKLKLLDDFDDSDGQIEALKTEILLGLMERGARLHHYTYDTVYHNRCGDYDGEASGLITPLSENLLKEKMLEFALKQKEYCHHKFLASMQSFGIHYNADRSVSMYGDMLGRELSLDSIKEQDIYSKEQYSDLLKAREEEARKKREAEVAATRAKQEAQERQQYELLKRKFENG